MANENDEGERLKRSVSANRELTESIKQSAAGLENLFAEQKDRLRGSFKAVREGAIPASFNPERLASRKQPPTLVVVEDEDADFILLKRALYKAGATARVWRAHNAHETLRIVAGLIDSNPNLCLVMDVRLPGADGCELLKLVRASHSSFRVKCAFLTGMNDSRTEQHAYAEGADAFFLKPSHLDDWAEVARGIQRLAMA
jgi:CheY-like chemotaxis protein